MAHWQALGIYCYDLCIGSDEFWADASHIVDLCVPIVKLLNRVDGDMPFLGKVYEGMDRMIENIREIEKDPQRLRELEELAVSRWNQYYSPMHATAFVLDPEFQHKASAQQSDAEVVRGWNLTL